MSHAAHFLTRLERLAAPEVDLALSLYRDPRIVKDLISSLTGPNPSDRVALAMTEDAKGPWIIVAADGGFVTCLARGMHLGPMPIISRADVDDALRAKEITDLGDELLKKHPGLITRLVESTVLSLEEFDGIAAYQPVLEHLSVLSIVDRALDTRWLQARCESERQPLEMLELYWCRVQRHGHHASLLGLCERNPEGVDDVAASAMMDVIQIEAWSYGSLSVCARALWAAAHWRAPRFEALKKDLLDPLPGAMVLGPLMELAVLGFAHQRLFAEAKAFLAQDVSAFPTESRALVARLQPLFAQAFDRPLASIQSVENTGLASMARAHLRGDSRFEALQFALVQPLNVWARQSGALETLIDALPFIASCKANELYLPQALLNASGLRQPTRQIIEANVEAARLTSAHTPVVREPRVGRNEPCGCGSGKKHKRCCLATV